MEKLKLNSKLHFVVPVDRDDGSTIYVHAAPIGIEAFNQFAELFGRVFSSIYAGGVTLAAGPRIAMQLLINASKTMRQGNTSMSLWEGEQGVEQALIPEIRRLVNVVMPSPQGWTAIPYEEAIARNLFDEEDLSEVENALAFFTVIWRMHRKGQRAEVVSTVGKLWDARLVSLNSTAFAASLPKSTPGADTDQPPPEKKTPAPTSSVPV